MSAGKRVGVRLRGHGRVERRVEHRHVRHVGQQPAKLADAAAGSPDCAAAPAGSVARSSLSTSSSTTTGSRYSLPPCTTRWPTANRPARPARVLRQHLQHQHECSSVVGEVGVVLDEPPVRPLVVQLRARPRRCARRGPCAIQSPVRGVDELVLQARRPGVDDEDGRGPAHGPSPGVTRSHLLGLDRRDGHRVDDVGNGASAGEVVDRLAQPLQHRTDGHRTRRPLHGLVGRVAGVEVREDQHRRAARHRIVRASSSGPTDSSTAASYWIGPASGRSGRRWATSSVAARTLSTSLPEPDVPVE